MSGQLSEVSDTVIAALAYYRDHSKAFFHSATPFRAGANAFCGKKGKDA
jgi:hypothetical protein